MSSTVKESVAAVALKKEPIERKRIHAKRIFLESLGEIKIASIAKMLGLHRATVHNWRKKDEWDSALVGVKAESDKRLTETTVSKVVDMIDSQVQEALLGMKGVSRLAVNKLFKVDPATGRPLVDEHGNKIMNTALSASDLRALMSTMSEHFKCLRLHLGQPTDNHHHSGQVQSEVEVGPSGAVMDRIEGIMKTGDPEAQAALMGMIQGIQVLAAEGRKKAE